MRQKIVAGNWKMNGRLDSINDLLKGLTDSIGSDCKAECIVFPPVVYLSLVSAALAQTSIKWGAQNCFPKNCGAFTGEIATPMLNDYHCKYVLVGHSERRTLFLDDEKFVADKFHHVKEHGMIPILCIGETLSQREKGQTEAVLATQLRAVAKAGSGAFTRCVIAYEPVWAIGTGQTATPDDVQAVHLTIRSLMAELDGSDANKVSILYGGSVNEHNATALFNMPDVDGGLIGGASLNAQQFVEIVKCIN